MCLHSVVVLGLQTRRGVATGSRREKRQRLGNAGRLQARPEPTYAATRSPEAMEVLAGLVAGFTNLFTNVFLTAPLEATLSRLGETELRTLSGGGWEQATVAKLGSVSPFHPISIQR